MSKKKLKKMLRRALKDAYTHGPDSFGVKQRANAFGDSGKADIEPNILGKFGVPRGFGSGQTEQFLIGALLGAAAAYVLADEELRSKILKSVMKLYAGFTGGIEEFKEQMADLKAEVEAEHGI